ncbi:lipid II:glycine glycyltransferase FemX [Luoshenia tenuis]|jgi:peptidoglycan pentaglycine glycine transferase (the first glycine)|uniref:lipid II:glycine glycyltransferase FemX n=1 Tax=Luoshenia tenuis TaxID=2763654 RepID=UPI003D92D648
MRTTEAVSRDTLEEYEAFVSASPFGHFMQSSHWADVKDNWRWDALICRDGDGRIRGSMALLCKKVPLDGGCFIYSPRGPVCDMMDEDTVLALLGGARAYARRHRAVALKVDPDVEDSSGYVAALFQKAGLRHGKPLSHSGCIQPRGVFRVDLYGQTQERLLAQCRPKTRYNIRLAGRRGVTVRQGTVEDLGEFTRLMRQTGLRDGFPTRNERYFEKIMLSFGEKVHLYMADYEGVPIAGTLALTYGDKSWYLYGASGNEHREVMPNYRLQWEMMQAALQDGCVCYDMRGVPGDKPSVPGQSTYGLYRYKKGFGGRWMTFCGEWDDVLRPAAYGLMALGLRLRQGRAQAALRVKRARIRLHRSGGGGAKKEKGFEKNYGEEFV